MRDNAKWWSDDDDALLREKLQAGESFSQIATSMGRTRSAVAGRAARMRMPKPETRVPVQRRRPQQQRNKIGQTQKQIAQNIENMRERLDQPLPETTDGIGILELTEDTCGDVLGRDPETSLHRYCGEMVHRRRFCHRHWLLYYTESRWEGRDGRR